MGAKKRQTMGKMIRERERAEKRARKQEKKDEKKAMREAEAAGIPYPPLDPELADDAASEPAETVESAEDPETEPARSAEIGAPHGTPVT